MGNGFSVLSSRVRDDLAEVGYRIRYRGYRAGGFIPADAGQRFADRYDEQEGSETFVAFSGASAIGTIRLVRKNGDEEFCKLPAGAAFIDSILQHVPAGAPVIEFNRFVIDPDYQGAGHSSVKRILFKAALTAAINEKFHYALGAVREEHLAFYARLFGARPVGRPTLYPGLTCAMRLMVMDLKNQLPRLRAGRTASLLPPLADTDRRSKQTAVPALA